ncbi:MAG: Blue-light-activated protein [Verrucomicrobiales bacterium]|nr:Blue-light-activated protein [Verrucomicrobiales bacterium]
MTLPRIRVLIIDDDEDDFIIARDLFLEIAGTGYMVDWASTYAEALERMREQCHDVYLIDFRLGADSGLELLKEAHAVGINAPMILLTGLGDNNIDMEAMRAGAEDFLVKGKITAQQLERAVRYAIERKRAETEIQKLAAFPRFNPNPVLEFSAEGKVTYGNDAAQFLATSLGKESLEPILPPNARSIVSESLFSGENVANLQTSLNNRTFSWRFVPIQAAHVVHCYCIEITDRLNLEAQLRQAVKMDAVGQLAAGIAHDFNNILTIIQGHASLLVEHPSVGKEVERPLKQICTASERAANLIRQLLMFSRKQVMHPTYLNINNVINDLMQMIGRILGEHVTINFQGDANLPTVYADASMIEQVLLNLAINARDAMQKGGQLTIGTQEKILHDTAFLRNTEARSGHYVCLKVTDTGCGIEPRILNRIFEPFFTTKEVGKGTGLGLATVYGIVKQHEGWLEVQSTLGLGTTFEIYLPVTISGAAVSESDIITPSTTGGKETILVVEDEPALRDLVVDILQLYGYFVYKAESGPAALKLWAKHKDEVDLLLTDLVMPEGMSGRDLAEQLQADKPELKVIYTSGYSPGMAGKDIALLEGFNFLPKPYPPGRLAQMVRECLDGRIRRPEFFQS